MLAYGAASYSAPSLPLSHSIDPSWLPPARRAAPRLVNSEHDTAAFPPPCYKDRPAERRSRGGLGSAGGGSLACTFRLLH